MKSNTINKLLLSLTIFIICFFSIGFSVLNKELTITGNINYRPKGDIRITNIENGDITGATIQYIDYSRREIKLGYKSTGSASVSIKVQVTNFENNEMGILSITNLPDDAKISDYTLGQKLTKSDGNPLKAGDSLTFTITFTSTVEELKEYNLIFDFEPICKISYENIEDTASLPKEVLKNTKNFTINFGSSAPDDLQVTMGDTPLEDYTYSNGSLIIPSVTGDIVVTGETQSIITLPVCPSVPSYSDNSGANQPVLNGDMIPVVYSEECGAWIKQDLNKTYDYNQQVWANVVTIPKTSYSKKLVGTDTVNITNSPIPNYKSTNQEKKSSTSNLTLSFKAKNQGVFSFDWAVSSESSVQSGDKLTIKVDIDGSSKIIVDSIGGEGGTRSGHYDSSVVSAGSVITITADYKKDRFNNGGEDTAYIKNLLVLGDIEISSTGDYKWEEYSSDSSFSYSLSPYYELSTETGIFSLKKAQAHSFSADDVGKYMCLEQNSTTCSELYEITKVDGNAVTEVKKYVKGGKFLARDSYKVAPTGTIISMNDINTMWVWIPRYSYTIKKEDGSTDYYGKKLQISTQSKFPNEGELGEIDVKFISKNENHLGNARYTGDTIDGWRTNEAFNFDNTPRDGLWFAKFEAAGKFPYYCDGSENKTCDISNVVVKPGVSLKGSPDVSGYFYIARTMQKEGNPYGFDSKSGDLHMLKNDEWGAATYLYQSQYGKYGNNDYDIQSKLIFPNASGTTGNSAGRASGLMVDVSAYDDLTTSDTGKGQAGPGASTTGTIYGIYDMVGGLAEAVMGVLAYKGDLNIPMAGINDYSFSGFNGMVLYDYNRDDMSSEWNNHITGINSFVN